jgi:hypothetical protein
MLSQIVRPLVQTQIRLLSRSQATRSTLAETIACWLGYLGVHAQVTQLGTHGDRIQVSLSVGKPEACDNSDWQSILGNLQTDLPSALPQQDDTAFEKMSLSQERHFARLIAYLLQVSNSNDSALQWDLLQPQLAGLDLEESLLQGIQSALKVPQSLDSLLKKFDPDLAAIALPVAVKIALLDRQITPQENDTLTALLALMGSP